MQSKKSEEETIITPGGGVGISIKGMAHALVEFVADGRTMLLDKGDAFAKSVRSKRRPSTSTAPKLDC